MVEDSKKHIRQRYALKTDDEILIIPQNPIFAADRRETRKLRVCAYCRVSTPDEAQTSSFEIQRNYYEEYIPKQENWIYSGIYADEGISGTNLKKRDDFNRMITDCKAGKIDLIITKSVSRFSRNVVDCLTVVRMLSALEPMVGVYFQTENINTFSKGNETYLTILSAFSQEESRAKSESMLWSYEKRFANGNFMIPTECLLGYDKEDGEIVIEPEGAKTVKLIFSMYRAGASCAHIADILTGLKRPTGKGNLSWSATSVRNILRNERYCGDVVAQKTYTKDFYDHITDTNRGQKPVYYKSGHHEGIITQEEYIQALLLLASNRNAKGIHTAYTLTVIREGLLSGFIPINRAFGGYSAPHYIQAALNAEVEDIKPPVLPSTLPDYEVVRFHDIASQGARSMTITNHNLSFNRSCVLMMPGAQYVEILLDPVNRQLAIRETSEDNPNAIGWCQPKDGKAKPVFVNSTSFCKILYELMGWKTQWRLKLIANRLHKDDDCVLIFDLCETVCQMFIDIEASGDNQNGVTAKSRKKTTLLPTEWRDSFGVRLPQHLASCRKLLAMQLGDWSINAPGVEVKGFERFADVPSEEEIRKQMEALTVNESEFCAEKNAQSFSIHGMLQEGIL